LGGEWKSPSRKKIGFLNALRDITAMTRIYNEFYLPSGDVQVLAAMTRNVWGELLQRRFLNG
jgi:hypothetical protein